MPGIVTLVNRNCSGYSPSLSREFKKITRSLDGHYHETYDQHSLEEAVSRTIEENPDYLALAGGDGSLLFFMSEFFKAHPSLPPIVYLAFGKENKLGVELGTHRAKRFFHRIATRIKLNQHLDQTRYDLMQITTDRKESFYSFDFGAGLPVNFLLTYYGIKREEIKENDDFRNLGYHPTYWDAFKTILKYVFSSPFTHQEFARNFYGRVRPRRLVLEGKEIGPNDYLVIFASTNEHLGKGFCPFYLARTRGKAQFMAIWSHPFELANQIFQLRYGKRLKDGVIDTALSQVNLEFNAPTIIQMGGEFKIAQHLEITLPKSVDFVVERKFPRGLF